MRKEPQRANLKLNKDLVWVERMSKLLDNKFSVGGFRFGLDPLLNFFPFLGKPVSFGISLVLVIVMWRNGASSKLALKMTINVLIDAIFGSIPILGNIFDFFHKANQKNVNLLRQHYYEEKHRGSAVPYLAGMLGLLMFICILVFFAMWKLSAWVIHTLF